MNAGLIIGRKYTARSKVPPRDRKNLGKLVKVNDRYHWFERDNTTHGENMGNYNSIEEKRNSRQLRGITEQFPIDAGRLMDRYLYYVKAKSASHGESFVGRYIKNASEERTGKKQFYIQSEERDVYVVPSNFTFYRQPDPTIGFHHGEAPPSSALGSTGGNRFGRSRKTRRHNRKQRRQMTHRV